MDVIKKFLGVIWLLLSVVTAYFCIFVFGVPKLLTGKQEDLVFGLIILVILTPIIVGGLAMFGYFAVKGEYSRHNK
jgi:hypothetical protein